MDPTTLPVFDFANPWVALIQIALFYVLPRIVGLVTDRLTASVVKIVILGVLAVVTSSLTWLLDVAVAQAWATLDWTALINVIVNAAITFAAAQAVYAGVIKPIGQADRDAQSTAIKLFGASPQREYAAALEHTKEMRQSFAIREAIGKADSAIAIAKDARTAAEPAKTTKPSTGKAVNVKDAKPKVDRSESAKRAAATRAANKAAAEKAKA